MAVVFGVTFAWRQRAMRSSRPSWVSKARHFGAEAGELFDISEVESFGKHNSAVCVEF